MELTEDHKKFIINVILKVYADISSNQNVADSIVIDSVDSIHALVSIYKSGTYTEEQKAHLNKIRDIYLKSTNGGK